MRKFKFASSIFFSLQVDSVNKQGILLEVIQFLTDLNLNINKAYISSDGLWFMDVFNVTDCDGNKIVDQEIMDYIKKSIETEACIFSSVRNNVGVMCSQESTLIELTGTDRPGLLSEVCAVLADLKCDVLKAELWTHNTRVAAIVQVTDILTKLAVNDEERLSTIKELLSTVLRGNDGLSRMGKTCVSKGVVHTERRLHQLMFNDRDYERVQNDWSIVEQDDGSRPHVVLLDCLERDYTIAILKSKDRPKLLFDTICTLTDMQYVVFHGTVYAGLDGAYQEYYIRHIDGLPVRSEAERQRVEKCLQSAIERRSSEGLEFELTAEDRVGLLSKITRIFRENGLTIRRAEVTTEGGKAVDSFFVSDMSGGSVDADIINFIHREIGPNFLRVKKNPFCPPHSSKPGADRIGFLFGNFLRACFFHSF